MKDFLKPILKAVMINEFIRLASIEPEEAKKLFYSFDVESQMRAWNQAIMIPSSKRAVATWSDDKEFSSFIRILMTDPKNKKIRYEIFFKGL